LNDTAEPVEADLRISLYREGRPRGTGASTSVTIAARGSDSVHADALFDGFVDLTYAYRFGPPQHDVVAATLSDRATGATLATAHFFPCGLPARRDDALGLVARAASIAGGYAITLEVDRFAHAVAIEAEGFVPDDNFMHIEPGEPRRVILNAEKPGQALHGSVVALNGGAPVPILSVVQTEAAC
jgi:beta-mannosidase